MKKILIPTDFSANAMKSADIAAKLAEKSKAELILFHAYHVPGTGRPVMIDISDVLRKEAIEKLEDEKNRILNNHKIKVVIDTEYGPTVPLIADKADKIKADLIVMGTKGASGLQEYFFGSNTSGMIRETKIPILAIPEGYFNGKPMSIVFAWDLNEVNKNEIDTIEDLAYLFDAEIKILHINEGSDAIVDEVLLKDFVSTMKNTSYEIIHAENVEEALIEYLKENNGILSLIARKHGFLEKMFHKSITKAITNHSFNPILIMKAS